MKKNPPSRPRHGLLALPAAVALVLLLGSCGPVGSLVGTEQALRDRGFQSVHVGVHPTSSDGRLDASVTVGHPAGQRDARAVASAVWGSFRERFDTLDVTVHGTDGAFRSSFSFAEMRRVFGARDPAWDRTSLSDGTKVLGEEVLGGLVGVGLVVALVVGVVATRRRRRIPAGGWVPGQPGHGPPPWPPGAPYASPAGAAPMWPPPPEPPRPADRP